MSQTHEIYSAFLDSSAESKVKERMFDDEDSSLDEDEWEDDFIDDDMGEQYDDDDYQSPDSEYDE